MNQLPDPERLAKHQYTVMVELEAPIKACFAAASAESAMMVWVPNALGVEYDHSAAREPYGAGSSRKVTVKPGITLTEVILISDAPHLCGYCIPRFGMGVDVILKDYQGRMNFEAISETRTRLTWDGYFDCPGWRRLFEPLFRPVMRNLVTKMAHGMQGLLATTQ